MTRILEQRDPEKVSDVQLAAHASDFIIAGSETTATAMSCILYYLLKNPNIMMKLKAEIRSHFKSYAAINSMSTRPLPYLKAVILEGLRIYPPLPFALPRVVPKGGDKVNGYFLPAGVRSAPMNVFRNSEAKCVDHSEHKSNSRKFELG
jgi:cytochrome P450